MAGQNQSSARLHQFHYGKCVVEVELRSARRRPRLAKSVDAVMQYVETEVAKLVAADPAVEAARQRAVRRAGRTGSRRAAGPQVATTY